MTTSWCLSLGAGCAAAALLVAPSVSLAQDQSPTADNSDVGAGEIVVTANKREQNLNKVGSTVSALSGEALSNMRVSDIADLARVTPGLTFAPSPNATPVYTLRGVGFFESTLAAYPDVAIYVDQVPLSLPVMSTLTAFDLERVEVLKGPQGTLFGNNATGGAINFVAAKPTDELHFGGQVSYGRFNTFEAQGFISGPLTDTLSARLAIKSVNGDDWQKSYTRDDSLGKLDSIAGRLILDWEATDALKLSLNLNGWRDQSDPTAPQKIGNVPQNPVPADFPLLAYPNAPSNARAADWGRFRPYSDSKFGQGSLRGDYDFGGVTLTSITSFAKMRFLNGTEGGGTALNDLDLPVDRGHIKSFTQEVRLSNEAGNRLRWVIGANFERTSVAEQIGVYYNAITSSFANGIGVSGYFSDQTMKNYAGFGNVEFDVNDQITLKGGIRQTKAKRSFFTKNADFAEFPITDQDTRAGGGPVLTLTQFFNGAYGAIYGGVVPTIAPGGSIILDTRVNADGTPVNPATYLTTAPLYDNLSEDSTSWSVGVDFKPSDDLLLYFNISKGYKAGSFPMLSGAIYDPYAAVTQESLLDFEGGFKAQLLDRKLSINGAAFYYDYRDKQLRAKTIDPIFGALDTLVNVPKSKIKGAEIEINAYPAEGLTLSGSATYLDAKVKTYEGVVGSHVEGGIRVADTASFAGVRLPFAPKLQYSVRVDYDVPVSATLNAFIGIGVSGQSKSIGILTVSPVERDLYKINARALVDGQIGVHSSDDKWRLSLWGKNIFNKYYWTNSIQAYDTVVRYAARPAEYGVTVGVKY